MELKIALAQINPVTGDLRGNTNQIIEYIELAKEEGVDIVVLPELAITGYCCGALFEQRHFNEYNLKFLKEEIVPKVTGDLICVIGHVELENIEQTVFTSGVKDFRIFNSCSVIQNGEIKHTYRKSILANNGHQEDRKYFTPGELGSPYNDPAVALVHKGEVLRIYTLICEDIWHGTESYEKLLAKHRFYQSENRILITPNYSYFYYDKRKDREEAARNFATHFDMPVVYLNPVGVGDIVKNIMIFDGGSFIMNSKGKVTLQCGNIAKKFMYQTIDTNATSDDNLIGGCEPVYKYKEIWDALVYAQREFFRVSGLKKAQIHISGGIDSAVGAAIAVEAMGPDNCVFITNPTKWNGEETKGYAQHISDKLGVELLWNPTGDIYDEVVREHAASFDFEPTPAGKASIQAVTRTVQALAASHTFGTGIIACGNHTELVLGWASFHDIGSIGALSIIGDLTKVEVFEFADFINDFKGDEIIPRPLYDGSSMPSAELPDSSEDPFDYFVVSGICAELIRNKKDVISLIDDFKNKTLNRDFFPLDWNLKSIYDKMTLEEFEEQVMFCFNKSKISVYKAAQAAPVPIISEVSRGFSSRETLINKYEGKYD